MALRSYSAPRLATHDAHHVTRDVESSNKLAWAVAAKCCAVPVNVPELTIYGGANPTNFSSTCRNALIARFWYRQPRKSQLNKELVVLLRGFPNLLLVFD